MKFLEQKTNGTLRGTTGQYRMRWVENGCVPEQKYILSTYTDYFQPDLVSSIDPILKLLNKWHLLLINYSIDKRRYMLEECGALRE